MKQKLHTPILKTSWELSVFDKQGNLLSCHKQPGHSWTRNYYNWILSQMSGIQYDDVAFSAGNLNFKDTGGTVRTDVTDLICTTGISLWKGPAANSTRGIQVGTGVNAEDFEDYKLQTLINNGVGAGQLSYILQEAATKNWALPDFTTTHIRFFNNNSGGAITVNEVAFTPRIGNLWPTVITRELLGAGVAVPDTGQLKVTYTITLTYP